MYVARNSPIRIEEKVLLISIIAFIGIGIAELTMGFFANSIGLMADGAHSFADSLVSILVISGIRLSKKAPDGWFRHGYGRAENLFGLLAAMVMVTVGGIVLYESYLTLMTPELLQFTDYAAAVALVSFVISTIIALYKSRLAKRSGSQALRVDALNSMKDGAASLVVLVGLGMSSLGYLHFDAIAGMVISLLIIIVGYISIRESSIVLMDGCICTDRHEAVKSLASTLKGIKGIRDIKFRKFGRDFLLEAVVELDGERSVGDAYKITEELKSLIMKNDSDIGRVTLEIAPKAGS
ncbi:MAG: cation diffusion facilitator family transporter [Candidatus Methanomethylicus sp.]|nr:cation diffusion facilitator family transporter [Candidatus Methanomethylicus sp.]